MRDGSYVSTRPAAEETEAALVQAILGRSLEPTYPPRRHVEETEPAIEVHWLTGGEGAVWRVLTGVGILSLICKGFNLLGVVPSTSRPPAAC